MTIAFKNSSASILTTDTNVYTCPALTSAVVFASYFTNIDGVAEVDVTIKLFDSSGVLTRTLAKGLPVPAGSVLSFGKIALEEGDVIIATSSNVNDIEATLNILEIS